MIAFSITGVFKMALMIIGALVVVKFIGQLMIAKRNLEEEKREKEAQNKFEKEKIEALKSFGKTKIVRKEDINGNVQDVEHEEINS
jgi:phosphotransferase system  glucose/maltose/N-acetylglucosamine-specific IIC component